MPGEKYSWVGDGKCELRVWLCRSGGHGMVTDLGVGWAGNHRNLGKSTPGRGSMYPKAVRQEGMGCM